MNYLEWVEYMRKDFKDADKELERVIELIKNLNPKLHANFIRIPDMGNL